MIISIKPSAQSLRMLRALGISHDAALDLCLAPRLRVDDYGQVIEPNLQGWWITDMLDNKHLYTILEP